jgi:hypothetical protein
MGREDSELIAQYVNANVPGLARFVEVPEMGHGGQHYLSMADAFAGKQARSIQRLSHHDRLVGTTTKETRRMKIKKSVLSQFP